MIVGNPSCNSFRLSGIDKFPDSTTLSGDFPGHCRVVNEGLSMRAVAAPTTMASHSDRWRCIRHMVTGVDMCKGFSPASGGRAIKPSAVWAHLSCTQGRPVVWAVMKRRFNSRHSCSSTPITTSIPASRSNCTPRPATLTKGSNVPTTTRGIPRSISMLAHGGVFP